MDCLNCIYFSTLFDYLTTFYLPFLLLKIKSIYPVVISCYYLLLLYALSMPYGKIDDTEFIKSCGELSLDNWHKIRKKKINLLFLHKFKFFLLCFKQPMLTQNNQY